MKFKPQRKWHTQCPYCYWNNILKTKPTLEELLKERAQFIENRIIIRKSINNFDPNEINFGKHYSLWKKFVFARRIAKRVRIAKDHIERLKNTLHEQEVHIDQLERDIQSKRTVEKRVRDLRKWHTAQVERNEALREHKDNFKYASLETIKGEYKRDNFIISHKDYKRGNKIDNHFRKNLFDKILLVFENKCIFCESDKNLTLDHFGIPKNEGGNFVLMHNAGGIKMNLIVLCRACNASKGEHQGIDFLGNQKFLKATNFQSIFLDIILSDEYTIEIIQKWYQRNKRPH